MKFLESTVQLQREAYGHVAVPHNPRETARSVKDNVLALIKEATEVLDCVAWKDWAHDLPWVDRERVIAEAVDAHHFLNNILVAVGCTDEEYEAAYRAKQAENLRRQRDGYRVKEKA